MKAGKGDEAEQWKVWSSNLITDINITAKLYKDIVVSGKNISLTVALFRVCLFHVMAYKLFSNYFIRVLLF